ncbi:polysaccharide biosynthesis/export family protein [Mucilaginibacter sp. Mucisp86]|uniref:polysaccharide biosynthesis/export family protein n=1 Tax=Mucilaginibacter sp. Mucisp86 TaxID=3243060 RepID=UPI0039B6E7EF
MRKSYLLNSLVFLSIFLISAGLFSCSSSKKIKYFQDIPDSGQMKSLARAEYQEPTIQVDDIITILIQTVDPQATAMINLGNIPVPGTASAVGSASSLNQPVVAGYLVHKDGFVEVPVLGRIKLLGYTTSEAKDVVLKEAVKYYKDPTVIVRYANFKFSVTGEVAKPGVYITPNEKVSILDAISLAGDLTIFGKRDNVLLIRENLDGSRTPYRINLQKSDIISSPVFYLRQNDVIYVEPSKAKAAATDVAQARTFTIVGAALSVLIVLLTRIK